MGFIPDKIENGAERFTFYRRVFFFKRVSWSTNWDSNNEASMATIKQFQFLMQGSYFQKIQQIHEFQGGFPDYFQELFIRSLQENIILHAFYWLSYEIPMELLGEHICTVNVRLFVSVSQELSRNYYEPCLMHF